MLISKYSFRALSLALCFGLVTSCAKREETDTTVTSDTTVTANGSDTRMGADSMNNANNNSNDMNSMSDGNILAFMGMADSMEIALGNMAKTKAKHADVKKFAQMMVTDHTKMHKEGMAVGQKQNIIPMMPAGWAPPAEMLSTVDAMKSATGATFDSLYIHSQVMAHEMVLNTLNAVNPKDTALMALGMKAKPHVEHHLEDAKKLHDKLMGK